MRDLERLSEDTKVTWAATPCYGPFRARDFVTIVHYRTLPDGTMVVVNRPVHHKDARCGAQSSGNPRGGWGREVGGGGVGRPRGVQGSVPRWFLVGMESAPRAGCCLRRKLSRLSPSPERGVLAESTSRSAVCGGDPSVCPLCHEKPPLPLTLRRPAAVSPGYWSFHPSAHIDW